MGYFLITKNCSKPGSSEQFLKTDLQINSDQTVKSANQKNCRTVKVPQQEKLPDIKMLDKKLPVKKSAG